MILGAHESVGGGYHLACGLAEEDSAEAVQIFVKSANRWFGKAISEEEVDAFKATFDRIPGNRYCAHGAYLLNLASNKEETRRKAIASLAHEIQRCEQLGVPWLVLHPGSHVGQGVDAGIAKVAEGLNAVREKTGPLKSRILLEVMAGQGTNLGSVLSEIREILEQTQCRDSLAICLDTCHLFAAGYAIHTEEGYREFRKELDDLKLTDKVRVVHLNDSEHKLGSRRDRHANIGAGYIGLEGFRPILNDPAFADCLGILETPHLENGRPYRQELKELRNLIA